MICTIEACNKNFYLDFEFFDQKLVIYFIFLYVLAYFLRIIRRLFRTRVKSLFCYFVVILLSPDGRILGCQERSHHLAYMHEEEDICSFEKFFDLVYLLIKVFSICKIDYAISIFSLDIGALI